MGGNVGTKLDRGESAGAAEKAAATRYLTRTGNADLLPILGLVDDPEAVRRIPVGVGVKTYVNCKKCKRRMWQAWDGACKRPDCAEVAERRGAR